MISDSIPNASVAMASSNPKDFAKKKRANRSAKLKQCKLDARREQWLSQVKNKGGCKVEVSGGGATGGGPPVHLENERGREIGKLEIKPRSEEEIYGDGSSMHSDSESLVSNSPSSHTSSVLGSNDSGVNFTTSSRSSSSSGRSTSSSSNGFCSGNMSEEDEGDVGDDDCLDDWEAVADALAATDNKQQEYSPDTGYGSPPSEKHETAESGCQVDAARQLFTGIDISNGNPDRTGTATRRAPVNCCAWRPDDACRPQTLPSLSKQYSFPLNSERHIGRGSTWSRNNLGPIPKSCPICFEDLDGTDSSFLPCSCGFRLCLFCHKRILEEDGRCPGCRKQYEREPVEGEATFDGGSLTLRLARSCSMIARS
ncbi:MOT2 transcription factor [Handroanthus impetiginosus]|uniref:MOT2 transcription factor n=1 Tax=Handroanthus impetiginosus TaxID=429701 RepID=A0A2G9HYP7_9LAMI|nr:MOT2 transcription factor [Handroanthus impetiginosus]